MDPLVWAAILMLVGVGLAVLELFVPSGGIIGVTSFISLMASIWMAFRHGPMSGLGFLAATVVLVPVAISLGFRLWPRTPIGRRVLLGVPKADEVLPNNEIRRQLKSLIGKVGAAKTLMMPSGAVVIDGQTIDALSEGLPIDAGQAVKVVEVRGTRVVVRATSQTPTEKAADPSDPLSQPIDSLGLDPFEDPLA
jgi:membrane-bound serine protease (ClpP class)